MHPQGGTRGHRFRSLQQQQNRRRNPEKLRPPLLLSVVTPKLLSYCVAAHQPLVHSPSPKCLAICQAYSPKPKSDLGSK